MSRKWLDLGHMCSDSISAASDDIWCILKCINRALSVVECTKGGRRQTHATKLGFKVKSINTLGSINSGTPNEGDPEMLLSFH